MPRQTIKAILYKHHVRIFIHITVHLTDFFLNNQLDALNIQIYSVIKLYMFQALCPSSGVFYCNIRTGKFHAGF